MVFYGNYALKRPIFFLVIYFWNRPSVSEFNWSIDHIAKS